MQRRETSTLLHSKASSHPKHRKVAQLFARLRPPLRVLRLRRVDFQCSRRASTQVLKVSSLLVRSKTSTFCRRPSLQPPTPISPPRRRKWEAQIQNRTERRPADLWSSQQLPATTQKTKQNLCGRPCLRRIRPNPCQAKNHLRFSPQWPRRSSAAALR
jgi:hypothetical protein